MMFAADLPSKWPLSRDEFVQHDHQVREDVPARVSILSFVSCSGDMYSRCTKDYIEHPSAARRPWPCPSPGSPAVRGCSFARPKSISLTPVFVTRMFAASDRDG